uniref:Uncharacterized protein n=1 Tax=Panagrolaimus sp. PS1159 TaxID=55785 RepID=A0AC35EU61_9BILA
IFPSADDQDLSLVTENPEIASFDLVASDEEEEAGDDDTQIQHKSLGGMWNALKCRRNKKKCKSGVKISCMKYIHKCCKDSETRKCEMPKQDYPDYPPFTNNGGRRKEEEPRRGGDDGGDDGGEEDY